MSRLTAGGEGLLAAFAGSVAHLEANVAAVNALNVFPVPDGDTGSNMLATVRAALVEAQAVPPEDRSVQRIAGAISFGALMGARGNSGVILSQVFRGMAEGLQGKRRFNGLDLAHALVRGRDAAYAAVVRPVEGTILTVTADVASASVPAAERRSDLESVLTAAVEAARVAVARTPMLLPILREAGVVDAGGQGLYLVLRGALLHMVGASPVVAAVATRTPTPAIAVAGARPAVGASAPSGTTDDGFGYETMFLLSAEAARPLDLGAIRTHLEALGESVLVAGDARAVKVHVHNERPDLVIGFGLTLGTLSRVSVENLDSQARDVREARAGAFTGAPSEEASAHDGGTAVAIAPAIAPPVGHEAGRGAPALSVVAVAAGDGIVRVLEGFGVDRIVQGGQGANPSTGELLAAIQAAASSDVLVLPNNPNVKLAAEQAGAMAHGKRVVVVPTRNAAEGFAALLVLDPSLDAAANRESMLRAARAVQTLQVTQAARDAKIGTRKVKKGHAIALDPDDGLLASDRDRLKATLAAVRQFEPGYELLTVYYGAGADLDEAERLARLLTTEIPTVEVELEHGGQPHYSYLISAE